MGTSIWRRGLHGLALAGALTACDARESPNIRLEPPATHRAGAQTTDFVAFVSDLVTTQTNDNSTPVSIDDLLFGNTQSPMAFDELLVD